MENNIYKWAAMVGLRIESNKGALSVEQLFTLKLTELDTLAVSLEESIEKSAGKSFLKPTSKATQLAKLKFDIVLDILTTKKEAQDAVTLAAEKKAHNDKILARIAKLDEAELDSLNKEQLLALMK